jgi:translation initiation factor IF-1
MPKDSHITLKGVISDVHPGGQFKVTLDTGTDVTARLCGKMRKNRIRVILGDEVEVSLSPYDLTHGIVTFRHK